jgi:hypothetical protein
MISRFCQDLEDLLGPRNKIGISQDPRARGVDVSWDDFNFEIPFEVDVDQFSGIHHIYTYIYI